MMDDSHRGPNKVLYQGFVYLLHPHDHDAKIASRDIVERSPKYGRLVLFRLSSSTSIDMDVEHEAQIELQDKFANLQIVIEMSDISGHEAEDYLVVISPWVELSFAGICVNVFEFLFSRSRNQL